MTPLAWFGLGFLTALALVVCLGLAGLVDATDDGDDQ